MYHDNRVSDNTTKTYESKFDLLKTLNCKQYPVACWKIQCETFLRCGLLANQSPKNSSYLVVR